MVDASVLFLRVVFSSASLVARQRFIFCDTFNLCRDPTDLVFRVGLTFQPASLELYRTTNLRTCSSPHQKRKGEKKTI